MAYDPVFTEDITWTSGILIDSGVLDNMCKNAQHNYNYGIHCGPIPGGKLKMARGQGSMTWAGGTGTASVDLTFASDADDGDPDFTAIPTVIVSARRATGGVGYVGKRMRLYPDESNSDENTCRVIAEDEVNPTASLVTYFNWIAIGY